MFHVDLWPAEVTLWRQTVCNFYQTHHHTLNGYVCIYNAVQMSINTGECYCMHRSLWPGHDVLKRISIVEIKSYTSPLQLLVRKLEVKLDFSFFQIQTTLFIPEGQFPLEIRLFYLLKKTFYLPFYLLKYLYLLKKKEVWNNIHISTPKMHT